MSENPDLLTFYRTRVLKRWRWRYQAAGNYENLANGSEGYSALRDAVRGATRVCGLEINLDPAAEGRVDTLVRRSDGAGILVRYRY